METRIAQIISFVFHPLLMPALGIFLLLNLDTYITYTITPGGKLAIYSIVLINTCIVPVFLAWFQYRFRLIKSLKMEDRRERVSSFFLSSLFYFFCYYILKKNNLPAPVYLSMLGAAISVTAAFLINLFWKISIHSIGMGGLIGMLAGISQKMNVEIIPLLFIFIIAAGMVGFARLKLNSHNPSQVYAGYMVGFLCLWAPLESGIL